MSEETGAHHLPDNIAHFARALRKAGLPVGPGSVLDALAAVEAARAGARRSTGGLVMRDARVRTRGSAADPRGARIDPRASFRRSLRSGGAVIELAKRSRLLRHPPIVALCDISGSMDEYTRVFLHFL